MTGLGITKKGLNHSTANFRSALNVMRPNHFIGAIGAGFCVRIGARWGFVGEDRFIPASLNWLRRRLSFELMPWSNQRETPPTNYAFFSALSLVVMLRPVISPLGAEAGLAASPTMPFRPSGSERVTLLMASTGREIWHSFRLLCERMREAGRRRGRASFAPPLAGGVKLPLVGKPLAGCIKAAANHVTGAASPATTAMRFGPLMQFFNEPLVSVSLGLNQNLGTSVDRNGLAMNPGAGLEQKYSWRPSVLRQNAANLSWADGLIVHHPGASSVLELSILTTQAPAGETIAQQSLPAISLTRFDPKQAFFTAGNMFTALQLTLAARPPVGRDTPVPGAPSFSSTTLRYAQREAQMVRSFRDALRDLACQSLVNDKPPTAPPPAPQIDQLTRQVYDQLKRELRIERERRGL
jgi:hypothetical protein